MNKREILVDVAKALIQLSIYLIDKRQKRKEKKKKMKSIEDKKHETIIYFRFKKTR